MRDDQAQAQLEERWRRDDEEWIKWLKNDPDYHRWLDQLDSQRMQSSWQRFASRIRSVMSRRYFTRLCEGFVQFVTRTRQRSLPLDSKQDKKLRGWPYN